MIQRADVVVIIPARYESSRFPGKPLALIGDKPLIQQVYERTADAPGIKRVIVATDDARILGAVRDFGGEAMLSDQGLRTGSDRVAQIAREIPADVYVNLQGDEIPMTAEFLEDLIRPFKDSDAEVGTLKRKITDPDELKDPNVVKVVTDDHGYALYFSRCPIPYRRDSPMSDSSTAAGLYWKHLGIYAYTPAALVQFTRLPAGILEASEQLEQLRLLEAGIRIRVWETKHSSLRIDTPEDLAQAEKILSREQARN